MKYIRLLLAAGLSAAATCALVGEAPGPVLAYVALAGLLGEFALPFLSSLSTELFELDRRAERVLPTLKTPERFAFPERLRVYVLDDDAPMMTWAGFRTLMISRGCYNLHDGEFRAAMQEAFEQRLSLRSFVLLAATVGNPIFLSCRVFCRIGRFFLRAFGMLIGAILGFRHMLMGGRVGASIGDGLYRVFSALFLLLGNVSVYVPYWPLLIWADLDGDRALSEQNLRGALSRLIEETRRARYTGRFMREYALILRPPAQWRLDRLREMAERRAPAGGQAAGGRPRAGANARRGGLDIPPELRNLREPPAENRRTALPDGTTDAQTQPAKTIRIRKISRWDGQ